MPIVIVLTDNEIVDKIKALIPTEQEVIVSPTYDATLAICSDHKPSLIIAQSHIETDNVFDFCTRVRLNEVTQLTPIIILGEADGDPKDKVRTFQVGADDYISPFDIDLVKAAIDHELELTHRVLQLKQEKEQAGNMVMEAMKNSSEMGNAISFIERCHRFSDHEEVANETIRFCNLLELKVVVGVMEDDNWDFFSSSGQVTTLERDLMQSIHKSDRFVDFGIRTQMNWPNIALLIKNMPLREPEKYGRIKDLMPTLLSSANVRIHAIYEEKLIKEQTSLMTRSIETLQPSIDTVITGMQGDNREQRAKLSEFLQQIIIALPGLGLEDDQEEFFINHVETLIQNSDTLAEKNEHHQDTLRHTTKVMVSLLAKQKEIQELMNRPVEIADQPTSGEDDLFELF